MRRGALAATLAGAALAAGACGSSGSTTVATLARSAPATTATATPTATATRTGTVPARRAPPAPRRPRAARGIPPAHPVPASFRVAAGAPSDAEVRRELAQMYAIQRHQQQISLLSPVASTFAELLPWSAERKTNQVSIASVFRDYGLGLACGGVLGRSQIGVAHKTAPCGTLVQFTYGGRSLVVPVIDRGPYIAGREWDLTGAAAAALAFPGLGQIAWSVVG